MLNKIVIRYTDGKIRKGTPEEEGSPVSMLQTESLQACRLLRPRQDGYFVFFQDLPVDSSQ